MTTEYLETRAKIWEFRFKANMVLGLISALIGLFYNDFELVFIFFLLLQLFCGIRLQKWSDLSYHQRLAEENEKFRKDYLNKLLGKNNV